MSVLGQWDLAEIIEYLKLHLKLSNSNESQFQLTVFLLYMTDKNWLLKGIEAFCLKLLFIIFK